MNHMHQKANGKCSREFKVINRFSFIALLIFSMLISGCWNKRELNQLAIVMGTGVDITPDGKISVTAQVVRPEKMKAESGGGGGGQVKPTITFNGMGDTAFDAIRNIVSISSRKLFWSHNQLIVIGEKLAQKGIAPVLDFFERDPELRAELPIAVAIGEVSPILNLPGKLEKTSAVEIHNALEASKASGETYLVRLHEFLLDYNGVSKTSFTPTIEVVKTNDGESFKLAGMAVFMEDKMIGRLNGTETRGLLWIINQMQSGIVVVKAPSKQGKISIELTKAKSSIEVAMEKGKPVFTVKIEASGNIGEQNSPDNITRPEQMEAIKKEIEKSIAKEVMLALRKAQSFKTDIFGFGAAFHRKYPKEWKLVKNDWAEMFPKVKVELKIKARINHSGDKTKASSYKNLANGRRP